MGLRATDADAVPRNLGELVLRHWPATAWRDVHVVVGLSGGIDSVALAAGMAAAVRATEGRGRLWCGHVNHHLRGADSDRQEAWVVDFARLLEIPLVVERRAVAARAAADGDGVEAAARAERYAALTAIAERCGARYVAVAHTRDDQAETVVMRVLRGAGLRGLGGMRRFRSLSPSVTLARPWLSVARAELMELVAAAGLDWFHDASNDDQRFTRNRVRHELLPTLRAATPQIDFDAVVADLASDAQEAYDIVSEQARTALADCRVGLDAEADAQRLRLSATRLAGLIPFHRTEVLRLAWREAGWPEQGMARRHWRQLAQLTESPPGATVNLPGAFRAARNAELIVIERTPGSQTAAVEEA